MGFAYINDVNKHPYVAMFDENGTHLPNSPLKLSDVEAHEAIANCPVNDDSMMIIYENTGAGHEGVVGVKYINKNSNFLFLI